MAALRILLALLLLAAGGSPAFGQAARTPADYAPKLDQDGKDVEWAPTPQVLVEKMLDLAQVTPADFVMDLGSGDGRTVISAAKRGARALGIEYNPDLVEFAKRNAKKAGVTGKASFVKADLFETDLSRATVITLFLLEELNLKLRDKLLALRPGTRIVSNTFTMGDWAPDQTVKLTPEAGCSGDYCTALLWIVPARVAGSYRHPQGSLTLEQNYQMLSGHMVMDGRSLQVEGRVRGDEVRFSAGGRTYRGRVRNGKLELG